MKKEYIIPIFVPNLGCPMACTFCSQKKITGQETNVTAKDVKETIEYYLKNFRDDNKHVEVAFFGGSFTGIDEKVQKELPNIVLPNMGIINNEKKIEINGKDYIKHKEVREE